MKDKQQKENMPACKDSKKGKVFSFASLSIYRLWWNVNLVLSVLKVVNAVFFILMFNFVSNIWLIERREERTYRKRTKEWAKEIEIRT